MQIQNDALALTVFSVTILSGLGQPVMPEILTQPTNQMTYIGSNATFTVVAAGSSVLRYQWRFNNADLLNNTNSTLKLLKVEFANAGPYSVLVSNEGSSQMSATAWLSVLPTNVVSVGRTELRFGELSAPIWEGARIDDQSPSVTGDGLTLFYASKAPGGSGDLDLWKVTRPTITSPWEAPVNLGPIVNSSADEADPRLSPDGLSLYFDSNRSGGRGQFDVWVATRASSETPFGAPVNLGQAINSSADDGIPQISADNRTLLFGSSRPGSLGEIDVWMSTRTDANAPWEPARQLAAPINSSGGTFPVALSRDGLLLFLKSWRPITVGPEPRAIYLSRRASQDQPFSPPVVIRPILGIGSGGADYSSLSDDGRTLYIGTYQTLYPDWPQLVQIGITPLPQLTAPKGTPLGQFAFELIGRPGANYELQSSPDLRTWNHWMTTNMTEISVPLSDSPLSTGDRHFYRALSH